MRRLLSLALRVALLAVVAVVVRQVLLSGQAPERALNGSEPLIGSLDTWPTVPRKP
jgi:hypothetical protein